MSDRVPELRELPPGLVLDGELVAFNEHGAPHWPLVVERVLHGNTAIPVTFVAFDLLRVDGHDVTCNPWSQRRTLLEGIWGRAPLRPFGRRVRRRPRALRRRRGARP